MAEYKEDDILINSQEEVGSDDVAKDTVHQTEIRRIQTGAPKEETAENEQPKEKRVKSGSKEEEPKKKRRWKTIVNGILTGEILIAEEANRVYRFLTVLGIIFLVSIFSMFGAFQQDLECSKLRTEVALLKERAIRTSERSSLLSTHSAVLNELQRRGIELSDPETTPIILR